MGGEELKSQQRTISKVEARAVDRQRRHQAGSCCTIRLRKRGAGPLSLKCNVSHLNTCLVVASVL